MWSPTLRSNFFTPYKNLYPDAEFILQKVITNKIITEFGEGKFKLKSQASYR